MLIELSYDEYRTLSRALIRAKVDSETEARGWEEREFAYTGKRLAACRETIDRCREEAGRYQVMLNKLDGAARAV